MKLVVSSALLSAIVAAAVALLVARPAPGPSPASFDIDALPSSPAVQASGDAAEEEIVELRMQIALLEQRITELEARGADPVRVPAGPGREGGEAAEFMERLGRMEPAEKEALREEIADVLAAVNEEKAAEERVAEIAKRVEQAQESYAEYDEIEANLGESMAKLGGVLNLDARREGELRGLVEIQNQRNREMTQLWSSGEVSDDELGTIFMANRTAHRAEVLALVGEEGLPKYREFVRDGGFGGLFSYFTAPWEEWEQER